MRYIAVRHTACPAAFRRLRVETMQIYCKSLIYKPAAFRRLRVETTGATDFETAAQPAAFRRLRVETLINQIVTINLHYQPPLGGCVLKHNQQSLSDCQ